MGSVRIANHLVNAFTFVLCAAMPGGTRETQNSWIAYQAWKILYLPGMPAPLSVLSLRDRDKQQVQEWLLDGFAIVFAFTCALR